EEEEEDEEEDEEEEKKEEKEEYQTVKLAKLLHQHKEESDTVKLAKLLHQRGFYSIDVGGGGHCQFKAVASQILQRYPESSQCSKFKDWRVLRVAVARWFQENNSYQGQDGVLTCKDFFSEDDGLEDTECPKAWQRFTKKMAKCGENPVWGNNMTLRAMAEILQIPIYVWIATASSPIRITPISQLYQSFPNYANAAEDAIHIANLEE
ncbi:hypothetical protein T484DRAFT_1758678, partial [Baffinella frigidus]